MTTSLRLFDPLIGDPFDSAFRRFLSSPVFSPMAEAPVAAPSMRLDITESNGSYIVKADLPGVKKEDINVRVDGNIVQIDAEVRQQKETKGEGDKVLRSERYFGSVSRTFSLAQDVDDARSNAKYDNGVLTLELPKKSTSASKKLNVQ